MSGWMSVVVLGAAVVTSACVDNAPPAAQAAKRAAPASTSSVSATSTRTSVQPRTKLIVHRSPTCECCSAWIRHMARAGFDVDVRNADDLTPVKEQIGVPTRVGACHTAEVAGYFVEGHVPAEDVARLLAERPKARGLSVPGMPRGSPGMPAAGGDEIDYDVLLIGLDGSTRVYAHHTR